MDIITLAQLNKLKKSGGVGYTDGGAKTLTFDGDMTGKEAFQVSDAQFMVKISDEPFSADNFVGIRQTVVSGGGNTITTAYMDKELFSIEEAEGLPAWQAVDSTASGLAMLQITMENLELEGISISKGVYALCIDDEGYKLYVERVDFSNETLHPIDPKFLPGVCLPVVELSTIDGALTPEEAAKMDEVTAMGVPIVVKLAGLAAEVCAYSSGGEGMFAYVGINVTVTNQTGNWIIEVTG